MCNDIQSIKSQIDGSLRPLADRLGLHTLLESKRSHTVFSIAFASEDLGLELNVDLADFFIYALLFKPSGGEVPVGNQDASGNRQKIYVQEALKQLGVDISGATQKLQQLGGDHRNCSEMLALIRELVEDHWAVLEAERLRWFAGH